MLLFVYVCGEGGSGREHCWRRLTLSLPISLYQFNLLTATYWQYNGKDTTMYVDPILPFGLRSAPKISTPWLGMVYRCIHHVFHYLYDFITVCPPLSPECAGALDTLNRTCEQLGIPITDHNPEGPTTCLTFYVSKWTW